MSLITETIYKIIEQLSKLKKIKQIIIIVLVFAFGFLSAWTFWLEPSSLKIQNYSLSLPHKIKIPNITVGIVSDIHIGRYFGDENRLRKIVDLLKQQNPDLIVFLGDFVAQTDASAFVKSAHELQSLNPPLGVFAVLGNHDWWSGKTTVVAALKNNGIHLIDNEIVKIQFKEQTFQLAGFGDFLEDPNVFNFIKENQKFEIPTIGITHNPDIFPLTPSSLSLLLAGHTHGGQVNFPFIGSPIVPSKYKQRYRYGIINENNHHLFVTSGTGNSILPVRFRVPPEIVIMDISFD